MFEQELRAYCREAERALACDKPHREAFRRFIEKSAREYQSERPDATFDELRALLGDPRDAAALFMDTLPPGTAEEWRKKETRRKNAARLIVGVLIAALMALLVFFCTNKGVFFVKTTIIDYGETYEDDVSQVPTIPPVEQREVEN